VYLALYLYPVPPEDEAELIDVFDRVSAVAISHGALADASFRPADLAAKYGLRGLDALPAPERTRWWAGLMLYRSREHFEQVISAFDADPEVVYLYDEFEALVDPAWCLRGEFELAAGGFASDVEATPEG
jgi:hypothetical protein